MKAQKIVVLDYDTVDMDDLNWDGMKSLCHELKLERFAGDKERLEKIKNADVVFTNKEPIGKNEIVAANNLRFIGLFGTGYNHINISETQKKNIIVSNIPGYSSFAVAQQAMALLLEITNGVGSRDKLVKDGMWKKHPELDFWGNSLVELYGKTLGIIGLGGIGQRLAHMAFSFGMNIIYFNRSIKQPENPLFKQVTLDELLKKSDIISLNCPLFPETKNIINENSIDKMKDGVIIINTSRGGLIDEDALAKALDSGKVAAAGCDVVSVEPIENSNPLLKTKNVFITPHMGWAPKETRQRCLDMATDNLQAFLKSSPINVVTL